MENLSSALEGLDGEVLIAQVGEEIGVDDWVDCCVGTVDGDIAAAERREQDNYNGAVVFTIERTVGQEVGEMTGIAVRKGKFQLGPVRWKTG